MSQHTQREWTVGTVLGTHENVGDGLHVGLVLGRDIGMTLVPHAGIISGAN